MISNKHNLLKIILIYIAQYTCKTLSTIICYILKCIINFNYIDKFYKKIIPVPQQVSKAQQNLSVFVEVLIFCSSFLTGSFLMHSVLKKKDC